MKKGAYGQRRSLSPCEAMIMKAVWDAGGDMTVAELTGTLKEEYGKEYARTTIATFLMKLSEKGFIVTSRKGKSSYVHAIRQEEEYRSAILKEENDFWYHGDLVRLFSALCKENGLTKEEICDLRGILDELDN